MTYAGDKVILDADSHVMELGDFLDEFIDPDLAPRLRRGGFEALEPTLADAVAKAEARRSDPAKASRAADRLLRDKGWAAMGGFDPKERSQALDLFGFDAQLVFATFATSMFMGRDLDRLYAGASAQNHAMASFCASDPRLLAVAFVPLDDPVRAVPACRTRRSGSVPPLSWFLRLLPGSVRRRTPTSMLSGPRWRAPRCRSYCTWVVGVGMLDPAFHNNAMPVTDHLGGGENIRSKDYLAIHHSPEVFLGTLILDGIFDRFPSLKGGCIEQGAGMGGVVDASSRLRPASISQD